MPTSPAPIITSIMMTWLFCGIIIWLFCGAIGAAIANVKNRNVGEGFLLGALLGVIGVIIVICLP